MLTCYFSFRSTRELWFLSSDVSNFLQNVHKTLGQLSGSASKCLEDVLDHHMSWGVALPALKDAGLLCSDYQRPTVDEEVKALREMALRDHPQREESESKESGSKRKGARPYSIHSENSTLFKDFCLYHSDFPFTGSKPQKKKSASETVVTRSGHELLDRARGIIGEEHQFSDLEGVSL